jgi:hypothetical protein
MHRSLLESLAPHKPPLRIGLLLDSRKLTRFFAEIVRQIIESEFAALELLIFHAAPETEAGRLFSRYQKWDRENADLATDPMVETDCSGIFEGIHSLPSEAVEPIRAKQLDVIFHCGLGVVEGEIPDCAIP